MIKDNFNEEIKYLGLIRITHEKEIDDIRNGIIHVYADWSGFSLMQTKKVFDVISQLKERQLPVYFLDNDLIKSNKYIAILKNSGKGETYLKRDGKIVAKTEFGVSNIKLKDILEH